MNEEEKREYHKKYNRWYYQRFKEVIKRHNAKYARTEKGKEVKRKAKAKYLKTKAGKESKRKCQAKFRKTKKGKVVQRKYHAKYCRTKKGKETQRKNDVKHAKTEKGKATTRKKDFKRRTLGFIELNDHFPNSDAHHIDKEFIIYIPTEMHRSVSHNVHTGKGMEEINNIAIDFCYGD